MILILSETKSLNIDIMFLNLRKEYFNNDLFCLFKVKLLSFLPILLNLSQLFKSIGLSNFIKFKPMNWEV